MVEWILVIQVFNIDIFSIRTKGRLAHRRIVRHEDVEVIDLTLDSDSEGASEAVEAWSTVSGTCSTVLTPPPMYDEKEH